VREAIGERHQADHVEDPGQDDGADDASIGAAVFSFGAVDQDPRPSPEDSQGEHQHADRQQRVRRSRHQQDLEPGRAVDDDIAADRHRGEQDQGDDREDDPRAGEPRPANAVVEGDTGEDDPDRRDGRPESLHRCQRLSADHDSQDHGQAAIGRDHPAHDRDRTDPKAGEVREVGTRAGQPDERATDQDERVARQGRARDQGHKPDEHGADDLHPRRDPQAADPAARQRGEEVERAPREGRAESG
jgi:hypothetical protein